MKHIEPSALIDDMRSIIAQTERLLQATADDASDKAVQARAKAAASLHNARKRLSLTERELLSRARYVARTVDRFVRDNPWRSIGAAALGGLVAGLIARK